MAVAAAEAGERLDRVLAAHLDLSRSRLKTLILAGEVAVGGRTIRDPGHRVNGGDVVTVTVPPAEPAVPQGEAIPLAILHEDDAVIVIDKPAGLVVHPAAGNETGTLVNALIAHCGDSLSGIGGVKRPGIVHRLDKDTSGVMVVAKTDRAHRALEPAVRRPRPHRAAQRAATWRSSGACRTGRAARSTPRSTATRVRARRWRCARAGARRSPTGKCWSGMPGPTAGRSRACWRAELETGRTHQIRVHLAHIGPPGAGRRRLRARIQDQSDPSAARSPRGPGGSWQTGPACLSVGLRTSDHGEYLEFRSELPGDLARLRHELSRGHGLSMVAMRPLALRSRNDLNQNNDLVRRSRGRHDDLMGSDTFRRHRRSCMLRLRSIASRSQQECAVGSKSDGKQPAD